jgi:hypothetical protein
MVAGAVDRSCVQEQTLREDHLDWEWCVGFAVAALACIAAWLPLAPECGIWHLALIRLQLTRKWILLPLAASRSEKRCP